MESSREGSARSRGALAAAAIVGIWASAALGVTAQFDVRLSPAEQDARIDVNEVLNLELWVTLSDGPMTENVLGYSVNLSPSGTGAVTVETFAHVATGDASYPQGIDNTPVSGAFSRGVGFLPSAPFTLGETRLALFSVKGLSPGDVSYGFVDAPPIQPWSFDFSDFSSAVVVAGPSVTIEVVPEPAMGITMLTALAWAVRSTRRRKGTEARAQRCPHGR